jgi:hypothetical protein
VASFVPALGAIVPVFAAFLLLAAAISSAIIFLICRSICFEDNLCSRYQK